jgi:hypothetical protein
MNMAKQFRSYFTLLCLVIGLYPLQSLAQKSFDASKTRLRPITEERDGSHDFDFSFGTWKMHLSRLLHPLTGSTKWIQLDGVSIVSKVWNGRANLVEFEVSGSSAHIQGLSLNLYNPSSHQWSLNFASSSDGTLDEPTIGEFRNGRGDFYDQESFGGRTILIRKSYLDITPNSNRFEEAFSDDGGKTWEVNWIANFTRLDSHAPEIKPHQTLTSYAGRHDFDFEIGNWNTHIRRLLHPLTGSTTWTDYEGTIAVRKVCDGRANLGELEAVGAAGHLEGLSLRLYNPQSQQWGLNFASSTDGTLAQPTIGEFRHGRGEFFDIEPYKGKSILVRSIFSDITPNSAQSEQAFSDDGGRTWEINLIEADTRAMVKSDNAKSTVQHADEDVVWIQ